MAASDVAVVTSEPPPAFDVTDFLPVDVAGVPDDGVMYIGGGGAP